MAENNFIGGRRQIASNLFQFLIRDLSSRFLLSLKFRKIFQGDIVIN